MAKIITRTCDFCGNSTHARGGPDPDAATHVVIGAIDYEPCVACVHAIKALIADKKAWGTLRAQSATMVQAAAALGAEPLQVLTADDLSAARDRFAKLEQERLEQERLERVEAARVQAEIDAAKSDAAKVDTAKAPAE